MSNLNHYYETLNKKASQSYKVIRSGQRTTTIYGKDPQEVEKLELVARFAEMQRRHRVLRYYDR